MHIARALERVSRIGTTAGFVCGILCSSLLALLVAEASADSGKSVPAGAGSEMIEGWLYVGRRTEDGWRPASISVSSPSYPVKPGDRLVIRQDALVYGSVDCKVTPAAEFKADGAPQPTLLVKADADGLAVAGSPIECPSIGQAKTVWASVRIATARLVTVQR